MEITKELIKSLHNRVEEYCIAKYKNTPDNIYLEEDGILATFPEWVSSSEWGNVSRLISPDELSKDLEDVRAKRIAKEEEEARQREIEEDRIKKLNAEREKEQRKIQYLKLKAEFETEEL